MFGRLCTARFGAHNARHSAGRWLPSWEGISLGAAREQERARDGSGARPKRAHPYGLLLGVVAVTGGSTTPVHDGRDAGEHGGGGRRRLARTAAERWLRWAVGTTRERLFRGMLASGSPARFRFGSGMDALHLLLHSARMREILERGAVFWLGIVQPLRVCRGHRWLRKIPRQMTFPVGAVQYASRSPNFALP